MVDEKLLDYVKHSLDKKVSKKKLTELLLSKGWSDSEVNEAINLVETLPEKSKIDSKPTEPPPKLKFPGDSKLVDTLIKVGCKDKDIAYDILKPIVKPEYLDSLIEEFQKKIKQKSKK